MALVREETMEDWKKEAHRICGEFLGGPWAEIAIEDLRFKTVSGGLSNTLYHCALPPESTPEKKDDVPTEVVFRIYGPLQDNTDVIVTEATTFMLLSERKLGPRLYGVFHNGRLEEFIPSRSLKSSDFRRLSTAIAREMAKIHALQVPVKKTDDFVKRYMTKWLNKVEKESLKKYNRGFALRDLYKEEIEWLKEEMKNTHSPLVYCNNDLQGGNILLKEGTLQNGEPSLVLIDFEFGAYNHRGFDIANHFCEWCFDYATPEFPHFTVDFDKFPTKEEQIAYISSYLDQLVTEGILSPSSVQQELQVILKEVGLFAMTAHLLWSLWSEKMSFYTVMDFAHKEHAKTRRTAYLKMKETFLHNTFRNGTNSH